MKSVVLPRMFNAVFAMCLLSALVGHCQDFDSTFWAQHPLKQPDSTLVKDTFWFPHHSPYEDDTYTFTADKARWAGKGARTYIAGGRLYSAIITLRSDHSFVFDEGHEVGTSLTVGRWWNTSDSTICLQWNDALSLHLCRDRKLDEQFFHRQRAEYDNPWPTRIDHWQFVRRGDKLIPLATPGYPRKRNHSPRPQNKKRPVAGPLH
jgi:hypothetical protein